MDAIEQLVWDSEISAAVLGKGEEYLLVPLDEKDTSALTETAKARGYSFAGVMSYTNGKASSKSEPNLEAMLLMVCAACAFAELVAERIRQNNPSLDWLERLHSLPDPRSN